MTSNLTLTIDTTLKTSSPIAYQVQAHGDNLDYDIDWGDGSPVETVTQPFKTHIYKNNGVYNIVFVNIRNMPAFGKTDSSNDINCKKRLIGVSGKFHKSTVDFEGAFYGCFSLENISASLFMDAINATVFQACFSGCEKLSNIPDGLFDNNVDAVCFNFTFRNCRNIPSIPKDLFKNNTKATSFKECFHNCIKLKDVPQEIVDVIGAKDDFKSFFRGCSGLGISNDFQ
jgi:hypothetical protein